MALPDSHPYFRRLALLELKEEDESSTEYVVVGNDGASEDETQYKTHSSLSFTPASTGSYLIIVTGEMQFSSTSGGIFVRVLHDGNAHSEIRQAVADTGDWLSYATALVLEDLSGAQTISVQFRSSAAGAFSYMRNVTISALRVDARDEFYFSESRGTSTTTTSDVKLTLTETPSAGEYLVVGCGVSTCANNAFACDVFYKLDGVSLFETSVEPHVSLSNDKNCGLFFDLVLLDGSEVDFEVSFAKNGAGVGFAAVSEVGFYVLKLRSKAFLEVNDVSLGDVILG